MAAATATGVAACQAEAAVRYSGVQDIDIPQFNSQPLSIDSDAYADILLKNYVFGGGNYQGATVSYAPGRAVGFQPNALFYARALSDGYVIDSSSAGPASTVSLAYGASNPNAEFNNAQGSFIGLSFPIGGALPENLHYGWVRVTIDNSAGTFVINDWAFNDVPGEAILAGELPQPLKGDFNNDGSVTTADYTVWRDNLGATRATGSSMATAPEVPSTAAITRSGKRISASRRSRVLPFYPSRMQVTSERRSFPSPALWAYSLQAQWASLRYAACGRAAANARGTTPSPGRP